MHICKALAKTLTIVTLASISVCTVTAQSSISMPQMPSVSMPDMPTISVGNTSTGKTSSAGSSSSTQSSSSSSGSTSSGSSGSSASVTAKELQTLSQLGSLDTLSSMLGLSSSSSSTLSSLYGSTYTTDGTTNELLVQILQELERLREEGTASAVAIAAGTTGESASVGDSHTTTGLGGGANVTLNTNGSTESQTTDSANTNTTTESSASTGISNTTTRSTTKPRVLRFSVNGYNVLSTCTSMYISSPETDGTFLVSGDRRYTSDGKIRTETFHILFRANGKQNGLDSYAAASQVNQDYLNQYSFLYQLAQKQNLTATRTGNLVTLRTTDPNWKLELLIDLGTQDAQ